MTKLENIIFQFCHGFFSQHLLYCINIKIIIYTKETFIIKKTLKKLINVSLALLLIANVTLSSNQLDTTDSLHPIQTTIFIDIGEAD